MPALAGLPGLAHATRGGSRDAGLRTMYLYFLVASGALFPLRFIPINYEWITLATTIAVFGHQLRRFGAGRLKDHAAIHAIIAALVLYQSVKTLAAPDRIDTVQFFRCLYGLIVLALSCAVVATSPLSRDRMFRITNDVALVLTGLVIVSIATGLRLYATGFLPEVGDEDIRDVISSGNYRIITYYSAFVVFLFFANIIVFFEKRGSYNAVVALACLLLIVLTGTRSLIAPILLVTLLAVLRYARPATTIAFAMWVAVIAAGIYAAIPDLVDAYLSRFYVGEAFDAWRALEQELTWRAIGSAPVFGLPPGVPYSNVMSALTGGTEGYTLNADYDLHNEYLWLLLYFGAVGCMALVVLLGVVVRLVARIAKGTPFLPSFLCYFLVMLASMNYSGILLKGYGALLFGLVIGVCTARAAAGEPPDPTALGDPAGHDPALPSIFRRI